MKKETVQVYSDVTGEHLDNPYPVGVIFDNKTFVVDIDGDSIDYDLSQLTLADVVRIGRVEQLRRNSAVSLTSELHRKAREWAQENDIEVGDRGMVPKDVLASYQEYMAEKKKRQRASRAAEGVSFEAPDHEREQAAPSLVGAETAPTFAGAETAPAFAGAETASQFKVG